MRSDGWIVLARCGSAEAERGQSMKNRENTNVTINNATDREAYNGVPLKVGEALVPMVVDEQFLDLNAVSADKVRTWQMAGITYRVVFYAVPEDKSQMAMQQYYSEVNDLLNLKLGRNRDSRCLIPQEDGSFKVCPKKSGDNRCACKDCPYNGKLQKEDRGIASLDKMLEEDDWQAPAPDNVEDEALLGMTLADLLEYLTEKYPRYHKIVTLGLQGFTTKEIVDKLGVNKSRAYQEINNAKKTVKDFLK